MKKFYLVFVLFLIIQYGFCQFSRMPLNYPHDAIVHLPSVISIVNANTLWVGTWRTNSWYSWLPYSDAVKSTDGGQTWEFYPIPVTGTPFISDVEAWDINTCYYMFDDLSGGGGQIWKTTDGGATWSRKTTTQFAGGYGDFIHAFSQDTLIAVGDPTSGYFEVQITNDGGNTWNRVSQSDLPPLILSNEMGYGGKSFGAIGNTIWFGTTAGRCFKSTDRGYHWTVSVISPDTTFGWWRVCFSDLLHGISYCQNRIPPLYNLTSDGGTTWTALAILPDFVYPAVTCVDGIYGGYILAAEASTGTMPTSVFYTNDFFASLTKIDSSLYSYYDYIYFKDATTGWLSGAYGNDSTILKFTGVLTSVTDKKPMSESLGIIPNPSNQTALVTFPTDFLGHNKTMLILDFSGRIIKNFDIGREETSLRMDSSNFADGVYIIDVITDNGLRKNARWIICH